MICFSIGVTFYGETAQKEVNLLSESCGCKTDVKISTCKGKLLKQGPES